MSESAFSMVGYVVRYPKNEWSRADAWHNLRGQQIPGCPDRLLELPPRAGLYTNGFTKCHEADHWAWTYWGALRPATFTRAREVVKQP